MRPPTLKPAAELAINLPHGHRVKYQGGCRCVPCRAANYRWVSERSREIRAGRSNALVSAATARLHLLMLSRNGVGRRTVHALSGVSQSVIRLIATGRRDQIRAGTERNILAVDKSAVHGTSLVDAAPTWKIINRLLSQEGFSKSELARRLGYRNDTLQLDKKRITAVNAAKVRSFYRRLEASV
ncbi:MAG TPA: hypothetical protein VKZ53_12955 [Candidatus Angelobacter sp.]|nr:hypothetical protein [Candidatus Angelobacter sp.]